MTGWTVPDANSDECLLRLSSVQTPEVFDVSAKFTIYPAPPPRTITITTPTSATSWESGSSVTPRWTSENIGHTEKIKAEYSANGGSSWILIGSNMRNDGTMTNWTVPDADSDECLLRLTSIETPEVIDVSAEFSIYPAPPPRTITITTPTASTSWQAGSSVTPRWTSENMGYTEKIKSEYSLDGGSAWVLIGSNMGNDGTMTNWTVPDANSDECLLRLTSVDTPEVFDVSEEFIIYP